jgi:hypothetical protein
VDARDVARRARRRTLVPGELRHITLRRGYPDLDVLLESLFARLIGRKRKGKPWRYAPVTVGPWGIGVHDETIAWWQIPRVLYLTLNRGTTDNPRLFSQLDFELGDSIVRAVGAHDLSLSLLADLHPQIAFESSRRVALTLDGRSEKTASSFDELLAAVRLWLQSDEGRATTTRIEGDYRNAKRALHPDLEGRLSAALRDAPTGADPGPFAAIVGAELGIEALGNPIAAMASSPHPSVASVAIGAALRVGVSPIRVGRVAQVEPYLSAQESRAITAWAAKG